MAQGKRTVFIVLLGVLLTIVGSASVAIAAPSIFTTKNECKKAVIAGVYEVYSPRYFEKYKQNPIDGVTKIAAPTEFVACAHMRTMTGKKEWVVQAPGTMLRFHVAPDGSLTPYARHDCGNEIDEISYPQEVVPDQPKNATTQKVDEAEVSTPPQKTAKVPVSVRDVCAERGLFGERFTNRLDEYGKPYCNHDTPWYQVLYESEFVQYPVNIGVGAGVGYAKGGELGALVGAFFGGSGTYAARKIAGEGNEEWGWVGLPIGVVGGALADFGDGGGSVSSTLTGPSSGGTGIGEVISAGGGGIP